MGMDVDKDLDKLVVTREKCQLNIQIFTEEINRFGREKAELWELTKEDNDYNNDSLVANMERIDDHIGRLQVAVDKEKQYIVDIDRMVSVLEAKRNGNTQ